MSIGIACGRTECKTLKARKTRAGANRTTVKRKLPNDFVLTLSRATSVVQIFLFINW